MTARPVIDVVEETTSTNDVVRERLADGRAAPFWVRADRQTAGRGRRGRTWRTVEGNVHLSGALCATIPPAHAAQASLVTAVAVADAFAFWLDPNIVTVKWPNDILLGGEKAAGVLVEAEHTPSDGGGQTQFIIGVGANVVAAPDAIDQPATALAAHLAGGASISAGEASPEPPEAHTFATAIAGAIMAWFETWERSGFDAIRAAWLARAHRLGASITATAPEGPITGVFQGIDASGALLIDTPESGLVTVTASDVVFNAHASSPVGAQ